MTNFQSIHFQNHTDMQMIAKSLMTLFYQMEKQFLLLSDEIFKFVFKYLNLQLVFDEGETIKTLKIYAQVLQLE